MSESENKYSKHEGKAYEDNKTIEALKCLKENMPAAVSNMELDRLKDYNSRLIEKNDYLRGKIDAYERVLDKVLNVMSEMFGGD